MGTQQTKGRGPTRDGGGDRERLGLRVHAAKYENVAPEEARRHDDDDDNDEDSLRYAQPPTHDNDGREERAPCRPICMDGCRSSRRPLPAMPTPSANGVSIHWPRPSRPSCTIVQGSPPSRTSGTITSQSGSGIPPTEPKHKHKHRSHLESPNPPKIQNLQLAKVRTKRRRLESGRGRRTTEAVTVALFTTTTTSPSSSNQGPPRAETLAPHSLTHFHAGTQTKPLVPPIDTTDDRGWTREVTPKQLHLFKKATHFFPLCHSLAVEAPSYPVPPRGNYLMIR